MEYKCVNCGCQLRTFSEEVETLFTVLLEETIDDIEDEGVVESTGELARVLLETEYSGWCGSCAAEAYIN